MDTVRNKSVIRTCLEAADRGDMAAVAACYAPDYVDHGMDGSRVSGDREGTLATFRELAGAFGDLRHEILDLIAEGDRVVLRVSVGAKHESVLRGVPATGHTVSMTQTVIYRLRDGLIVERWLDGAQSVVDLVSQRESVPAANGEGILSDSGEDAVDAVRLLRGDAADWKRDASGGRYWELGLSRVSVTYFRLEPFTRFPMHAHTAEQITGVLEGRLFFEIGEERYEVGPGDAIAIPGGVPHAVSAGPAAVEAFDAWSPPPAHLGTD